MVKLTRNNAISSRYCHLVMVTIPKTKLATKVPPAVLSSKFQGLIQKRGRPPAGRPQADVLFVKPAMVRYMYPLYLSLFL